MAAVADGVEETIKELKKIPGFSSYLIINNDGIVIKYENMSLKAAIHYASLVLALASKATKYIKELFEAPDVRILDSWINLLEAAVMRWNSPLDRFDACCASVYIRSSMSPFSYHPTPPTHAKTLIYSLTHLLIHSLTHTHTLSLPLALSLVLTEWSGFDPITNGRVRNDHSTTWKLYHNCHTRSGSKCWKSGGRSRRRKEGRRSREKGSWITFSILNSMHFVFSLFVHESIQIKWCKMWFFKR